MDDSDNNEKIKKVLEDTKGIGFTDDSGQRAGTFIHENDKNLLSSVKDDYSSGLIMLDIFKALEKYPWLKDYYWKLIQKDKDEYTNKVYEKCHGGFFIYAKKGVDVSLPIQSCMVLKEGGFEQSVHNIIYLEEGAKINILSACLNHENSSLSRHYGVTEVYLEKNSELNYTMIHEWNPESFVRPRTVSHVAEDAKLVTNYITLNPVKDIQMNPRTILAGKNASTFQNSLIYGQQDSNLDIGGEVELAAKNTRCQLISRAISDKNSVVNSRGKIIGKNPSTYGHLECHGLILSDKSILNAIPELSVLSSDSELSHEAAVGKIANEKLIYLMSHGLSEKEAVSVIVRGFLDVKILGLPKEFSMKVQSLIDKVQD